LAVAVQPRLTPRQLRSEHQLSRAPRHRRCVAIVRQAADVMLPPFLGSLRS